MLIRVTSERARWPRQIVRAVYKALKVNGYDGPEPQYNELWMSLFDWCASTAHCGWREMLLPMRRRCDLLHERPHEGVGQAWQETQRLSIFPY